MLEADISEDSLSDLAHAITTALRPAPSRRLIAAPPLDGVEEPDGEILGSDEGEGDAESAQGTAAPVARTTRPRKFVTPKVIDVELDAPVAFAEFAASRGPKGDLKKFLTVAAWFKEHRGLDSVTADHVYTCFKKVGWSTSIKDFGQPLRDLSRQGHGSTKQGSFTINHIGLDAVQKLTSAE